MPSAVGVVMLIVCANLSNLQLARLGVRQKEFAMRAALGAARVRLLRQMLTESIALSCCGAVLGLSLAIAGTSVVAHLNTFNIPLLGMWRVQRLDQINAKKPAKLPDSKSLTQTFRAARFGRSFYVREDLPA